MFKTEENSNLTVPKHIAIILDGNGRWAKKNGKERIEGHYEGVVSVRSAIISSINWGVKVLTVYAFSTENWGRPQDEVEGLMELFCKTIAMEISSLKEQKVKVIFIGDKSALSSEVLESVEFCETQTAHFDNLTLCVALNYGSRAEITNAFKILAQKCVDGEIKPSDISEQNINDQLYTQGLDAPDLVIRSSGEQRLSNFLLWQVAYSEFYFTSVLWPDFREEEFDKAIAEYSKRVRRFGAL
ncbi:MAG: isoprenyl transferase [Rikenellaceae bacterium]